MKPQPLGSEAAFFPFITLTTKNLSNRIQTHACVRAHTHVHTRTWVKDQWMTSFVNTNQYKDM